MDFDIRIRIITWSTKKLKRLKLKRGDENKNNNLVKHKLKGLKLKMSRKKNMTKNDSDQNVTLS